MSFQFLKYLANSYHIYSEVHLSQLSGIIQLLGFCLSYAALSNRLGFPYEHPG